MRYEDFDSGSREEERFSRLRRRFGSGCFGEDFGAEFPKILDDIKQFGFKFGRIGEEISRHMHDSFRDDPTDGEEPGNEEEVRIILDLLKAGKISVDEAESLIAAVKGKQRTT